MSELLEELPPAHLEYPLRHGAVGDWLVLGPIQVPLAKLKAVQDRAARLHALRAELAAVEEITQLPSERATCVVAMDYGTVHEAVWRVVNTLEDRRVDLAQRVITPHALFAWAYAQVVLPSRVHASLILATASPVEVWINGEFVFAYDELPDQPTDLRFVATLDEGTNEIWVRVATAGQGDLPLMLSLRIPGIEGGVVTLPTSLEPVKRRQKLVAVMDLAYLSQDVYARKQRIIVRWPTEMQMVDALSARLQTPAGRIVGEANPMIQRGAKVDFGEAAQFPDGAYEVLLQPQFEEYYVQNMRVQRRLPLQIRNGKWSLVYHGTDAERRQEALEDAARRTGDISAEIAKGALGKWDALNHEVIERTLAQISHQESGCERSLLALLGWVARMGDLPDFPKEVAWALEESAPLALAHLDENGAILPATCHLLAGQFYPQRTFGDLHTGEWHRAHAEEVVLRWLRACAQMGLPQGESQQIYVDALMSLSHLVDMAYADTVAEMAAALLDKLAYQLALQSFLGVWGGSRDQGEPNWMLNGRLGPLCGLFRLWWGQGIYNDECAAVVALACAEGYTLPEIIAAVGLDRQQESWQRRQDLRPALLSQPRVNRAAYRTGDYLLASAQGDWAAGTPALLWQVTLGPDAILLGNRPACSSHHGVWQASYWRGSAAPVRVAQWKNVLAVAYGRIESHSEDQSEGYDGDALLDFSHAYFPMAAFDEVQFVSGWAVARKENGYVALTATGGVEMVSAGRTTQREVRAEAQAVWLVQMGRAANDGTFAHFVEKVLAQPLTLEPDRARYRSLMGQEIDFRFHAALHEALRVDGVAQPLKGFPHLESIYGGAAALPATSVEIAYHDHLMRLDFDAHETPARIEEA
ncbi:MAG: hypothetical protein IT328_24935 [Caldilineaceae bacterium]|nr:hypothetical protein [Caldilineaceae bacterium]